jgi:ribosomal protein L34E
MVDRPNSACACWQHAALARRRRPAHHFHSLPQFLTHLFRCRLALLYVKKQASVAKCGDCGCKLRGVKALRPMQNKKSQAAKRLKHVSRAYGGARYAPDLSFFLLLGPWSLPQGGSACLSRICAVTASLEPCHSIIWFRGRCERS